MKPGQSHQSFLIRFICAAGIACAVTTARAGDLNPPAGPITATMKPLSEIEPRIALSAANTPGDADSVFRITSPGSYYLTVNLSVPIGKSGIEIAANNVTIDLMGHNIQAILTAVKGISVDAPHNNITIRNGSVTGFPQGGVSLSLAGSSGTGAAIEYIQASGNSGGGIFAGAMASVSHCTAFNNGSTAIGIGVGSVISNCAVSGNSGHGFSANSSCILNNCTATGNANFGFIVGVGCTVFGCSAYQNSNNGITAGAGSTVSNCSAFANSGSGITLSTGCTVIGCSASFNSFDGILCVSGCTVRNNTCVSNGNNNDDGAGIHATSTNNRIEGNNCTLADRGIDIDVAGNFIVKNTCSDNTLNWDIAANNFNGPIINITALNSAAVQGNSGAASLGTTEPNANFSY